MAPRRLLPLFAALSLALAVGSCSKNPTSAPGIDSEIQVRGFGPSGVAPAGLGQPWAWAVNSIDSVLFLEDIDVSRTEVTSMQLFQVSEDLRLIVPVPGTVVPAPSNAYIRYTGRFPSAAFDFEIKNPPARTGIAKMYFVPSAPLHGHTQYAVAVTHGIRMQQGELRRSVVGWTFTTGDSVAPPSPRD